MHIFRGLLFDSLGLKFTALLLALLVYLNVYTDRTTTMLASFPVEYTELDDSLSLTGPVPSVVQAEVKGTGKQLIFMRVKEPRIKLSLAGARRGRLDRALALSDLPLPADGSVTVENLVGPRVVTLEIERLGGRCGGLDDLVHVGNRLVALGGAGAWAAPPSRPRGGVPGRQPVIWPWVGLGGPVAGWSRNVPDPGAGSRWGWHPRYGGRVRTGTGFRLRRYGWTAVESEEGSGPR